MKSVIRRIEPVDGFYPGDGLEDMYKPESYSAYGEANALDEASAKYNTKCVVVKRTIRRYTHA